VSAAGGYDSVQEAQARMCGLKAKVYKPNHKHREAYDRLFGLYRALHDAFGTRDHPASLHHVMKDLLAIRDAVRGIGQKS
jgi:L-ribulokinase